MTTTADAGPGSLRQAIINANTTPNGTGGPDVISFGIRNVSIPRIALSTPLPAIVQPVSIDGTTQAGYNPAVGDPVVHVTGNGSSNFQGLIIESSAPNTLIRGLSLTGFGSTTSTDTTAAIRTSAADVRIEGNWIGLSPLGLPMANQVGIWILGGNPSIGGVGGVATRNVIAAGGTGIYAAGGANASIRGNFIGTSPNGLTGIGNSHLGINVQPGVNGFVIGGPLVTGGYFATDSPANLISGNAGGGIELQANAIAGPANTQILGNVIGLSADGSDMGNNNFGIRAQGASGTQIGAAGAGNVISGNGALTPTLIQGRGVIIATNGQPQAVMPIVRGNKIGVSVDGTLKRANILEGIVLEVPAVVGGTGVGDGNLISGNGDESIGGAGILTFADAGGSIIQGNIIGLSSTGLALANNSGIAIDGTTGGMTIGGPTTASGNVVSGNRFGGVNIFTNSPAIPANVNITGNYIGTNAAGVVAGVGNGGYGISITAGQGHQIGGLTSAAGNFIAGNGTAGPNGGIQIAGTASGVGIRFNSIFANNGLGIDIVGDGPDANDPGDADAGPNGRQNAPALTAASVNDGATRIMGSLPATSGVGYDIQLYVSPSCDASGFGEGQTYLMTITDATAVGGTVPIDVTVGSALTIGHAVTATARNRDTGDSSEFSNCATVQTPPPTDLALPGIGGSGGGPFAPINCAANGAVTAFRGEHSSSWFPVGALGDTQPWCSTVSAGAVTGSAALAGSVLSGEPTGSGWLDYGSALTCPGDKVIQSVHGQVVSGIVTDVTITCTLPNGTAPVEVGPAYSGTPRETAACPAGQVVVGISGRSGWFIDRLELSCGVR